MRNTLRELMQLDKIKSTTKSIGTKDNSLTNYQISNGCYFPSHDVVSTPTLPAGVYMIQSTPEGRFYFKEKEMIFEDIVGLPDMQTNRVLADINKFWDPKTKTKYDQLGLIYKRGILMHGTQGTGKSSCIFKVCEEFTKNNGVVIFNPPTSWLPIIVQQMQSVEPDRKILVIFEEFDEYCDTGEFLNLLDGELQLNNIVYIATTNHIEAIPPRIKNRPSRFAQVIEIGKPTFNDRMSYLSSKLSNILTLGELEDVAFKTDGFVLDQVKDVVISTFIFDNSIDDAVAKIKTFNSAEENAQEKLFNTDEDDE